MDSSPDLSPFLLDLDLGYRDLDLKALDLDLDLDSDLEVLPASPFYKSFVLYLYLKNVLISYLRGRSCWQTIYTHTREHHSDTATDVSVAELLARYLRDLDGD